MKDFAIHNAKQPIESRGRTCFDSFRKGSNQEWAQRFFMLNLECWVHWIDLANRHHDAKGSKEILKEAESIKKYKVPLPTRDNLYLENPIEEPQQQAQQQPAARNSSQPPQTQQIPAQPTSKPKIDESQFVNISHILASQTAQFAEIVSAPDTEYDPYMDDIFNEIVMTYKDNEKNFKAVLKSKESVSPQIAALVQNTVDVCSGLFERFSQLKQNAIGMEDFRAELLKALDSMNNQKKSGSQGGSSKQPEIKPAHAVVPKKEGKPVTDIDMNSYMSSHLKKKAYEDENEDDNLRLPEPEEDQEPDSYTPAAGKPIKKPEEDEFEDEPGEPQDSKLAQQQNQFGGEFKGFHDQLEDDEEDEENEKEKDPPPKVKPSSANTLFPPPTTQGGKNTPTAGNQDNKKPGKSFFQDNSEAQFDESRASKASRTSAKHAFFEDEVEPVKPKQNNLTKAPEGSQVIPRADPKLKEISWNTDQPQQPTETIKVKPGNLIIPKPNDSLIKSKEVSPIGGGSKFFAGDSLHSDFITPPPDSIHLDKKQKDETPEADKTEQIIKKPKNKLEIELDKTKVITEEEKLRLAKKNSEALSKPTTQKALNDFFASEEPKSTIMGAGGSVFDLAKLRMKATSAPKVEEQNPSPPAQNNTLKTEKVQPKTQSPQPQEIEKATPEANTFVYKQKEADDFFGNEVNNQDEKVEPDPFGAQNQPDHFDDPFFNKSNFFKEQDSQGNGSQKAGFAVDHFFDQPTTSVKPEVIKPQYNHQQDTIQNQTVVKSDKGLQKPTEPDRPIAPLNRAEVEKSSGASLRESGVNRSQQQELPIPRQELSKLDSARKGIDSSGLKEDEVEEYLRQRRTEKRSGELHESNYADESPVTKLRGGKGGLLEDRMDDHFAAPDINKMREEIDMLEKQRVSSKPPVPIARKNNIIELKPSKPASNDFITTDVAHSEPIRQPIVRPPQPPKPQSHLPAPHNPNLPGHHPANPHNHLRDEYAPEALQRSDFFNDFPANNDRGKSGSKEFVRGKSYEEDQFFGSGIKHVPGQGDVNVNSPKVVEIVQENERLRQENQFLNTEKKALDKKLEDIMTGTVKKLKEEIQLNSSVALSTKVTILENDLKLAENEKKLYADRYKELYEKYKREKESQKESDSLLDPKKLLELSQLTSKLNMEKLHLTQQLADEREKSRTFNQLREEFEKTRAELASRSRILNNHTLGQIGQDTSLSQVNHNQPSQIHILKDLKQETESVQEPAFYTPPSMSVMGTINEAISNAHPKELASKPDNARAPQDNLIPRKEPLSLRPSAQPNNHPTSVSHNFAQPIASPGLASPHQEHNHYHGSQTPHEDLFKTPLSHVGATPEENTFGDNQLDLSDLDFLAHFQTELDRAMQTVKHIDVNPYRRDQPRGLQSKWRHGGRSEDKVGLAFSGSDGLQRSLYVDDWNHRVNDVIRDTYEMRSTKNDYGYSIPHSYGRASADPYKPKLHSSISHNKFSGESDLFLPFNKFYEDIPLPRKTGGLAAISFPAKPLGKTAPGLDNFNNFNSLRTDLFNTLGKTEKSTIGVRSPGAVSQIGFGADSLQASATKPKPIILGSEMISSKGMPQIVKIGPGERHSTETNQNFKPQATPEVKPITGLAASTFKDQFFGMAIPKTNHHTNSSAQPQPAQVKPQSPKSSVANLTKPSQPEPTAQVTKAPLEKPKSQSARAQIDPEEILLSSPVNILNYKACSVFDKGILYIAKKEFQVDWEAEEKEFNSEELILRARLVIKCLAAEAKISSKFIQDGSNRYCSNLDLISCEPLIAEADLKKGEALFHNIQIVLPTNSIHKLRQPALEITSE
jgi:hypothetical protein